MEAHSGPEKPMVRGTSFLPLIMMMTITDL